MAKAEKPRADRIRLEPEGLVIFLPGERIVRIPWEACSPRLAQATVTERSQAELSPSGYGIHWPLPDEDLSVAGLLRDKVTP